MITNSVAVSVWQNTASYRKRYAGVMMISYEQNDNVSPHAVERDVLNILQAHSELFNCNYSFLEVHDIIDANVQHFCPECGKIVNGSDTSLVCDDCKIINSYKLLP